MLFKETKLKGAYTIEPERREDERGFFARVFCQREYQAFGLNPCVVQCSVSFNKRKGTLRGMHYQVAPDAEVKVIRCCRGAIYDVMVDLRPQSPTFMQHVADVLSSENGKMFYIPEGFAHGFQTLEDNTEVQYQMSAIYAPESARGIRWNDPSLRIEWPSAEERIILARDREYPLFSLASLK